MNAFISYSRKDEEIVQRLITNLEYYDVDIKFDGYIQLGDEWWDSILRDIKSSNVFIFAISYSSMQSEACKREREYADKLGKFIIPLVVDEGFNDYEISTLPDFLVKRNLCKFNELMNIINSNSASIADRIKQINPNDLPKVDIDTIDPPTIPIHPLTSVATLLEREKLTFEEQEKILTELRIHAENGRDDDLARTKKLLNQFLKRTDKSQNAHRRAIRLYNDIYLINYGLKKFLSRLLKPRAFIVGVVISILVLLLLLTLLITLLITLLTNGAELEANTPTPTETETVVPTNTQVTTNTSTAISTPTATAASTPTATSTPTPTPTPSETPTATNTPTPTPTATNTLTPTPTATNTPTSTSTPTPTVTNTLTSAPVLSATPVPTNTPTPTRPPPDTPIPQPGLIRVQAEEITAISSTIAGVISGTTVQAIDMLVGGICIDIGFENCIELGYDVLQVDSISVTFQDYQECLNTGGCTESNDHQPRAYSETNSVVVNVSWEMATEYCEWRGMDLLSKEEWALASYHVDGMGTVLQEWTSSPPQDSNLQLMQPPWKTIMNESCVENSVTTCPAVRSDASNQNLTFRCGKSLISE